MAFPLPPLLSHLLVVACALPWGLSRLDPLQEGPRCRTCPDTVSEAPVACMAYVAHTGKGPEPVPSHVPCTSLEVWLVASRPLQ